MALEAIKGLSAQVHSTEKSHRFGKMCSIFHISIFHATYATYSMCSISSSTHLDVYCLPYLKRSLWSRLRTGEQRWRGESAHRDH